MIKIKPYNGYYNHKNDIYHLDKSYHNKKIKNCAFETCAIASSETNLNRSITIKFVLQIDVQNGTTFKNFTYN